EPEQQQAVGNLTWRPWADTRRTQRHRPVSLRLAPPCPCPALVHPNCNVRAKRSRSSTKCVSRVNTACQGRFGDPADGQHVPRQTEIDIVLDGRALDVLVCAHHYPP